MLILLMEKEQNLTKTMTVYPMVLIRIKMILKFKKILTKAKNNLTKKRSKRLLPKDLVMKTATLVAIECTLIECTKL
jgi:hypothetical protein